MFKRSLFFIIVLLIALPTAVSAHTHLETSDPEENSVLNDDTESITLTFDSIVQEVNELTLTGENGEVLQPEFTHEPADTLVVTLPEEMEDGDYTLFFSIVSEDGHVMEQELSYQFEGLTEATPEEEATDDQEVAEDPVEEDTEETDQVESEENEVAEDTEESNNSTMIIMIAIVLVIVAILAVVMMRKNKK